MKITDSAIEEIIGIFLNYFALFAFFAANRNDKGVIQLRCLGLETNPGKGHHSKHGYKVFTERGLYMLATILKGEQAVFAPRISGSRGRERATD